MARSSAARQSGDRRRIARGPGEIQPVHRGELAGGVLGEREGEQTADRRAVARRERQAGEVRERLRVRSGRRGRIERQRAPKRCQRPRVGVGYPVQRPVMEVLVSHPVPRLRAVGDLPRELLHRLQRVSTHRVEEGCGRAQPNRSFAAHASARPRSLSEPSSHAEAEARPSPARAKAESSFNARSKSFDRRGPSPRARAALAPVRYALRAGRDVLVRLASCWDWKPGPSANSWPASRVHQIGQAVVRIRSTVACCRASAGGYIRPRPRSGRGAPPCPRCCRSEVGLRPPAERAAAPRLQAGHSAPRPMRSTTA